MKAYSFSGFVPDWDHIYAQTRAHVVTQEVSYCLMYDQYSPAREKGNQL